MQAPVTDLLIEAAALLMIGMLVVFTFLALMIGAIHLIAAFCQKFPGPEAISPVALPTTAAANNNRLSSETAAAISAAVHKYRKTH